MANQLNLEELSKQIEYSEKYYDDKYEYRHVILPKELARYVVKTTSKRDLSEKEWRYFGIQMSKGWIHYGYHDPEPHILLFRRLFKGGPTPRVQMEMEISTNDSY